MIVSKVKVLYIQNVKLIVILELWVEEWEFLLVEELVMVLDLRGRLEGMVERGRERELVCEKARGK